jgi:hypothetical protein
MNIDHAIAKLEADLAALKRARDLMNRIDTPKKGDSGSSKSVVSDGGETWQDRLPEMLSKQSLTVKEIEKRLKEQFPDISYTTVFSWIKRAVKRGEYAKSRSRKYRYNPNSSGE